MAKRVQIHAPDISCNHCAMTIRRELASIDGVQILDVDVPEKRVHLQVNDDDALSKAMALLEEIGYPGHAEPLAE
ncbi:MAG: heavy-metal-associated domain-containing protein [Chloroflexi bacterium]|nr:heavy-metal-associated domain-containing protein [Chloroflexota bacterium]